jgi:hypothetical protein
MFPLHCLVRRLFEFFPIHRQDVSYTVRKGQGNSVNIPLAFGFKQSIHTEKSVYI